MNIRKPGTVRPLARELVNSAPQRNKIMLIYCGILAAVSLLVNIFGTAVSDQMAGAGGLSNLQLRSFLSTVQRILPIVSGVVMLGLDLGLRAAFLRISREQYTSPQTLRMGISRLFPMVRCALLQGFFYVAIAFATIYAASMIFFLTPMSNGVMELLMPMVTATTDPNMLMDAMMMDEALMMRLLEAMLPVYLIWILLALALIVPLSYRLRLSPFVILDDPRAGAFRATKESFRMTRGNCSAFFKLDLSYWWYYLLLFLVSAVSYGDLIASLLGAALPWSDRASMYIFYILALAGELAVYCFFRPQVEVSSILIYNAIRPREQPQSQVVLGNIFEMANENND